MLTPEKDPPRNAGDKLAGFPTDPYTPSQYGYRNVPNVTNRGLSDANYVGVNTQTGFYTTNPGENFDITFKFSGKQFMFNCPPIIGNGVTDPGSISDLTFYFYFNEETSPITVPATHFAVENPAALLYTFGTKSFVISGKAFSKVRVLLVNTGAGSINICYAATAFEESVFVGCV